MSDSTKPTNPAEALENASSFREDLRRRLRIPVATCRLQMQPAFTFQHARAIVPYLAKLGFTDGYCSPYFMARSGSTHGYDVCDYSQLNPELGTEADYDAFLFELGQHGMGHVLDFVPNHMAVEPVLNRWWRDMLEHGESSPYARFFDIDWDPVKPELQGKILLPFLGDHYGHVLERGELQLVYKDGGLMLRYFDAHRPIDPRQYPSVLRLNLGALQAELKPDDPNLLELLSILTALSHLPSPTETAPERVAERLRESRLARERLARLIDASPRIRQHLDDALRVINGEPGRPQSFDALHELLEAQSYRLAYWKTALHEINFRRFFDINQLAGLRMEDPAVFAATHSLVLRLVRQGKVTGLRLDHIDGLFDPLSYLETLQSAVLGARAAEFLGWGAEPTEAQRRQLETWHCGEHATNPGGAADRPLYVVSEKILSGSETLPASWPHHGTTGYDFLNDLNRLFIDPRNARTMKRDYEHFTQRSQAFADVVYECKRLISGTALASELNVLGHALNRISEGDRRARDFTLFSLRQALREVVSCFPVYRTYVNAAGATETDRLVVDQAIQRARYRNPAMEASVFDFVRESLLPDRTKLSADDYQARLKFAMKFQQYTGPLQAKGIEDTAFYRYNVLVSLNEVGGDPQRFGGTPAQFHEANQRRLAHSPYAMLATATHDMKRGEDARARLNVLSEIPDEWRRQVSRWTRINARNRVAVEGEAAPDRNDEYLFYQALLGCWPAEPRGTTHAAAPDELVQRLRDYMLKAVKEAKVHTSWISPNVAYDQAVAGFVEKSLVGPRAEKFLAEFLPFQQGISQSGMVNSLAQVILKIISPGVPDFYQGTELWDLSLVDPDNRRPVDFAQRLGYLDALSPLIDGTATQTSRDLGDLLANWHDGRVKLFVTACGLQLRRRLSRVFLDGEYLPLEVDGEYVEHVVAVARRFQDRCVVAVVPRFATSLGVGDHALPQGRAAWKSTRLRLPVPPQGTRFRNVLTHAMIEGDRLDDGLQVDVAVVLNDLPIALLSAEPA